jgi:hypothetical protein
MSRGSSSSQQAGAPGTGQGVVGLLRRRRPAHARVRTCALLALFLPLSIHHPSIFLSVRRPAAAAAALSPFSLRVRCTEISLYLSTTVGEVRRHRLLLSLPIYHIRNAIAASLLFSSLLWPRLPPTLTTVAAQASRVDRGWIWLSVVQCKGNVLQGCAIC